jgi:hypothetical protein
VALQMLITDRMKLFAYKMVEEETIWDRKIQQHHKGRLAARGD